MGFSTPKPPFNLAEFLSQKGSPRSSRKPSWKRAVGRPQAEATVDAAPAPQTQDPGDAAE